MPAYDPDSDRWSMKVNKLKLRPRLGCAGYGNSMNYYS
jgi:hypothetical protein